MRLWAQQPGEQQSTLVCVATLEELHGKTVRCVSWCVVQHVISVLHSSRGSLCAP